MVILLDLHNHSLPLKLVILQACSTKGIWQP